MHIHVNVAINTKKMFGFKKKYTLSDLENATLDVELNRNDYRIAVIEDKIFPHLEALQRHEFNITLFKDIERLSMLNDFQIIVSDIRGVGKFLQSKLEGAHLIQEINKKFPNVYLIAYSSSRFDPTFNKYLELCDHCEKKSIDITEWTESLDYAIKMVNSPLFQWEKTRKRLLQKKVPLERISKIQNDYIKSIIKKKPELLKKTINKQRNINTEGLKSIFDSITKFTATFVAELLK